MNISEAFAILGEGTITDESLGKGMYHDQYQKCCSSRVADRLCIRVASSMLEGRGKGKDVHSGGLADL